MPPNRSPRPTSPSPRVTPNFPDETAASFHTSNAGLDAVWNLARHSALYDAQEQFLDTPTREKGPFLTDSYDVSQAAMAAFGDRMVTSEALTDFAHSQAKYWPDGRVNAVYPNGDGQARHPRLHRGLRRVGLELLDGDRRPHQLAALYPVVRNITDLPRRARSIRRRASSRTCPAGAATTPTGWSTGRRRCATATT